VVAPKFNLWIEFTTDRGFEQRADMLKSVRDLSTNLGFWLWLQSPITEEMVGKATLVLDVKEAVNIGSTPRRKGRRR
jgi:hypothetical protein